MIEQSSIIIDNDLILDVNTGIIGSKKQSSSAPASFPMEELVSEIDKLEEAINDIESSLNPKTISRLSQSNREGVYEKAGLITNIILGIIIALVFIILII